MLEAELDPGPEAETCTTKSSLAARRERQKTRAFTTIKIRLRSICKDLFMFALLETCVLRCSIIASEPSLLATFYVARMFEARMELEKIYQTFFNRYLCAVANIGTRQQCVIRDPELAATMHGLMKLLPAAYYPVDRLTCMTRMLLTIARQMHQNFSASIPKNLFPIPPAEIAWMTPLCVEVRVKIGPLSVQASTKAYLYLPFLYSVLHDLEAHNLDASASNEDGLRGFKLLSILPQKNSRPINISIDNATLVDIHSKLLADMKPNHKRKRGRSEPECTNSELKKTKTLRGKELWTHYFKVESSRFSRGKELETFITTDGISVSVVLSQPKCDPAGTAKATEQPDPERMCVLLEMLVLLKGATRVFAVDPGRIPVFTAIVHNEHALEELRFPDSTKNEVVKWSRA